MARKKKHEEHVNHERWLVSYADFITLLFATFTALFAISNADKEKFAAMAKSLKNSFSTSIETNVTTVNLRGTGIDENDNMGVIEILKMKNAAPRSIGALQATASAGTPIKPGVANIDGELADPDAIPEIFKQPEPGSGPGSGVEGDGQGWAPQLSEELKVVISSTGIEKSLIFPNDSRGLVVSLSESTFFERESTLVKSGAVEALNEIVGMLHEQGYSLRIEGHTDNEPLKSGRFESHLELSALRASKLASYIGTQFEFEPGSISAAGFGADFPIADNGTSLGRARNRRVDIVILPPKGNRARK